MFDKLSSTKGIGEATIRKLAMAGLDDAKKIVDGGKDALKAAGLNSSIAEIVLNAAISNLTEPTPAPAPAPEKKAKKCAAPAATGPKLPGTVMGDALARALAKQGRTVEELSTELGAKAEQPPCCAAGHCGTDKCGGKCGDKGHKPQTPKAPAPKAVPEKHPLDLGLEGEPLVLTNPAQIRDIWDKLPEGGVPQNALFIRGVLIRCEMCFAGGKKASLIIDTAMVLVISNQKEGTTVARIFCEEHLAIASAAAKQKFEGNSDVVVETMPLRTAWARLCSGYQRQIAEAKAARAAEDRKARRETAVGNAIEALDNADNWLTEEELGSYESPLKAPVWTGGLDEAKAHELLMLPTEGEVKEFEPRWKRFKGVYDVELAVRPPRDVSDHLRFVQHLRDRAKEERATPRLSLMVIRRHFGKDNGWRYLIVHESIVDQVLSMHESRTGFTAKTTPWAYDWLTRRWVTQVERAKADATQAYKATPEGQTLEAFLSATGEIDETLGKDGALLVSGSKRK